MGRGSQCGGGTGNLVGGGDPWGLNEFLAALSLWFSLTWFLSEALLAIYHDPVWVLLVDTDLPSVYS